MNLSIGLSLTRPSGPLGFNPASLFASGEEGAWYDPSDLSTVWQDAAGTTPATAGDPVGRIDDKSGNGNHATQSTPTARPTLQTSGGLYYLDFDGSDDWITKTFASSQAQPNTLAVAWKFDALSATFNVIADSATGSAANRHLIRESSGDIAMFAGTVANVATPDLLDNVGLFYFNTTSSSCRINGSVTASSVNVGSSPWTGITLGQHISVAGNHLNGRIYGFVGVNRTLTASEIDGVESYLAAKSGVTI